MIIDCHTHIGRNEHIKASVDDLLKSMDKSGIDKSLVFAGSLQDAPNEWMLERVAAQKEQAMYLKQIELELELEIEETILNARQIKNKR